MHEAIGYFATTWHLALLAALTVQAVRSSRFATRALALEAVTLVMVPLLALVALSRGEAGYLDIAIAVALLGFVQTVAIARIAKHRRELR